MISDNIMCIPKTSAQIIKCGDFITPIMISELTADSKTILTSVKSFKIFCKVPQNLQRGHISPLEKYALINIF